MDGKQPAPLVPVASFFFHNMFENAFVQTDTSTQSCAQQRGPQYQLFPSQNSAQWLLSPPSFAASHTNVEPPPMTLPPPCEPLALTNQNSIPHTIDTHKQITNNENDDLHDTNTTAGILNAQRDKEDAHSKNINIVDNDAQSTTSTTTSFDKTSPQKRTRRRRQNKLKTNSSNNSNSPSSKTTKDENVLSVVEVVHDTNPKLVPTLRKLQPQTNLNMPPPNWLQSDDRIACANSRLASVDPQIRPERTAELLKHQDDPISGSSNSGDVDFLAPTEQLKQLFKSPYNTNPLSLTLHRIGKTIVVDECPAKLEQQREQLLSQSIHNTTTTTTPSTANTTPAPSQVLPPPKKKNTKKVNEKKLYSKFLYYSVLADDEHNNNKNSNESSKNNNPNSDSESNSTNDTETDSDVDNNHNHHQQQQSQTAPQKDPAREEATTSSSRRTDGAKKYRRIVRWQLSNLKLLLGSDLVIFRNNNSTSLEHGGLSVNLHNANEAFGPEKRLDLWLDNIFCHVPETAVCLHHDGFVQGYKLLKTEDLPHHSFKPQAVLRSAHSMLEWIKANSKKTIGTYWLVRDEDSDAMHLYDVTNLDPHKSEDGEDKVGTSGFPVASLCFAMACRLAKMLPPPSSTTTTTTTTTTTSKNTSELQHGQDSSHSRAPAGPKNAKEKGKAKGHKNINTKDKREPAPNRKQRKNSTASVHSATNSSHSGTKGAKKSSQQTQSTTTDDIEVEDNRVKTRGLLTKCLELLPTGKHLDIRARAYEMLADTYVFVEPFDINGGSYIRCVDGHKVFVSRDPSAPQVAPQPILLVDVPSDKMQADAHQFEEGILTTYLSHLTDAMRCWHKHNITSTGENDATVIGMRWKACIALLRIAVLRAHHFAPSRGSLSLACDALSVCCRILPKVDGKRPGHVMVALYSLQGDVCWSIATKPPHLFVADDEDSKPVTNDRSPQVPQDSPQNDLLFTKALIKQFVANDVFGRWCDKPPQLFQAPFDNQPNQTKTRKELLDDAVHAYLIGLSHAQAVSQPATCTTHRRLANTYNELGKLFVQEQRFTRSISQFQNALQHFEKAEDWANVCLVHCNMTHTMRVRARWEGENAVAQPETVATGKQRHQQNVNDPFLSIGDVVSRKSLHLPGGDELNSFKAAFSSINCAQTALANSKRANSQPPVQTVHVGPSNVTDRLAIDELQKRVRKDTAQMHFIFALRLLRSPPPLWTSVQSLTTISALAEINQVALGPGGENGRDATVFRHLTKACDLFHEGQTDADDVSIALCHFLQAIMSLQFFAHFQPRNGQLPPPSALFSPPASSATNSNTNSANSENTNDHTGNSAAMRQKLKTKHRIRVATTTSVFPKLNTEAADLWFWHHQSLTHHTDKAEKLLQGSLANETDALRLRLLTCCAHAIIARRYLIFKDEDNNRWPQTENSRSVFSFITWSLSRAITLLLQHAKTASAEPEDDDTIGAISRTIKALGGHDTQGAREVWQEAHTLLIQHLFRTLLKAWTSRGDGCVGQAKEATNAKIQGIKNVFLLVMRGKPGMQLKDMWTAALPAWNLVVADEINAARGN